MSARATIEIDGFSEVVSIGSGGLGDVFRATCKVTGATVAIKVLRDLVDESVAWHRIRREFEALDALAGHRHVVQLIDLLETAHGPALVMEYLAGGSVAAVLHRRDATLSVAEASMIGRQVADALAQAHALGIIHRDVKPQNLLIDAAGQIKLCDFGISALTRSADFQVHTQALSQRYASPEELDNDAEVGPASDVYSLGATLLHIVRGAPPTLRERIVPWVPPPSDDVAVAALDAVIEGCLDPRPECRPTAATVFADLEMLAAGVDRIEAFGTRRPEPALIDDVTADPVEMTGVGVTGFEVTGVDIGGWIGEPTLYRCEQPDPIADVPVGGLQRPAARPSRRRSVITLLAPTAAVGALLLVGWSISAGSSIRHDSERIPGSIIQLDQRPTELPELTAVRWPFGDVGACLVQVENSGEVVDVGCEQRHDLQRFASLELDPVAFDAEAMFDQRSVTSAVDQACLERFESFVGISRLDSVLRISVTRPSAATWAAGDRRFQCLLGVPLLNVTGDARDARS
jgi:tRNA A-37 threonylcarbamoyl transferase component Bud32